jgi:hypothetical protein
MVLVTDASPHRGNFSPHGRARRREWLQPHCSRTDAWPVPWMNVRSASHLDRRATAAEPIRSRRVSEWRQAAVPVGVALLGRRLAGQRTATGLAGRRPPRRVARQQAVIRAVGVGDAVADALETWKNTAAERLPPGRRAPEVIRALLVRAALAGAQPDVGAVPAGTGADALGRALGSVRTGQIGAVGLGAALRPADPGALPRCVRRASAGRLLAGLAAGAVGVGAALGRDDAGTRAAVR